MLFSLVLITIFNLSFKKTDQFRYKTIKVENGWMYEIYKEDKLIIKQNIIPVISDNKPFYSKEDASVIAELMIQKLKKHQIPSISLEEIKSKKIKIKE